MNAAGQRRLTPWLIGACVVLAALWAVLLAGVGRGVRWDPPSASHPLPMAHQSIAQHAAPLAHYAVIWQRPLFTVGRRPLPEASAGNQQPASLDNLQLTGVILAPGLHIALLRDRSNGHSVRVVEGAQLAGSGWTLDTLKPRSAVFVDGGKRTRLTLKTPGSAADSAAIDPGTTPPPTPPPATGGQHGGSAKQRARITALKQRIEQRRRKQATQAGGH